jgi:hypothetical protein
MNPKHLHTPISPVQQRDKCPVCHEPVYSRAGIHPQCAMKQHEAPKVLKPIETPPKAIKPPAAPRPAGAKT